MAADQTLVFAIEVLAEGQAKLDEFQAKWDALKEEKVQTHTIVTRTETEGAGAGATEGESTAASSDAQAGGLSTVAKAAIVATAAIAAVAAGSIDLANKYQEATDQMAASANISVAQAQKIGTAFLATGGQTTFSAQEMMTAYGKVAGQMGQVEGHALDSAEAVKFMSTASQLAEASGTSLASSTTDLANIMQIYGMRAGDASHASDVLFSTARLTGQGVDAVTNAFTKLKAGLGVAAPSISDVGAYLVDLQEHGETGRKGIMAATTALTTLIQTSTGVAKAQADAKAVFDMMPKSLQELATRFKDGSITQTEYDKASRAMGLTQYTLASQFATAQTAIVTAQSKIGAMGITVDTATGKFVGMASVIAQLHEKIQGETQAQQLATVAQVFGNTAALKMLATIQAGPAAYDAATAAVNKTGAAHAAAEKATDNFKGSFDKLKGAALDIGVQLGNVLMPIVTTLMDDFTAAAPTIGKILVSAFGALEVIVKAVIAVLGFIIGNMKTFAPLIGVVVAGLVAFKAAMLISALISGVSDAMSVLSLVMGGELPAAQGVAALGFEGLGTAIDFATGPFMPMILAIGALVIAVGLIITHFQLFKQIVGDVFGFIKSFVGGVFNFLVDLFKVTPFGFLLTHLTELQKAFSVVWNGLVGIVKGVISGITTAVKGIIDGVIGVINFFIGVIDGALGAINGALGVIPTFGLGKIQIPTIPKIPTLDTGGIVTKPTLALLAMNNVPEAVTPLSGSAAPTGGTNIIIQMAGAQLLSDAGMDQFIRKFGTRFVQVMLPASGKLVGR